MKYAPGKGKRSVCYGSLSGHGLRNVGVSLVLFYPQAAYFVLRLEAVYSFVQGL